MGQDETGWGLTGPANFFAAKVASEVGFAPQEPNRPDSAPERRDFAPQLPDSARIAQSILVPGKRPFAFHVAADMKRKRRNLYTFARVRVHLSRVY